MPYKRSIEFRDIQDGTRVFHLRQPLMAIAEYDESDYNIDCLFLNIIVYGKNEKEAHKEFMLFFTASYDGLVFELNAALTQDAIELKHRFLDIVDWIEYK